MCRKKVDLPPGGSIIKFSKKASDKRIMTDHKSERMRKNMREDKKKFIIYMAVTFGMAWCLQIAGAVCALKGQMAVYQVLVALCMYSPLIGVVIAQRGIKKEKSGICWSFHWKQNWKSFLVAWFLPAVLTFLGALLYFAMLPHKFDLGCGTLSDLYSSMLDSEGTLQGIPLLTITIIQGVSAVTYAPLINTFAAIGEEAGWRGYMTPVLSRRMGKKPALIVSGIIWGIWHGPVIVIAGYEYGTGYVGAPFLGILLMCVFTTGMGIILSFFYEKTKSIWVPALIHGAINGVANLPVLFMKEMPRHYLLGPTPAGLIAGIPIYVLAAVLLAKMSGQSKRADVINED